MGISHQGS